METFIIGRHPVSPATLVSLARERRPLALATEAVARVAAARAVVDRYAAGDAPIYGLNTGLGGNLGHRLDPGEIEAFQTVMIRGRTIGVGEALPEAVCRGVLIARIVGLATGTAGISPVVLDHLVAMANRGVTPVIPRRGSIGAADLGLLAHLGAVVIGRGEAWVDGRRMPGGEALHAVGLAPARLGAKDGLGLLNASSIAVAHGAFVLDALDHWMLVGAAAAALAAEGYAANPSIFDARVAALRPAAGQAEAASLMRTLLRDSGLYRPGAARSIQDALSFRTLSPVLGSAMAARDRAEEEVAIELNGSGENPAVLVEDGEMLSSTNFHTPSIALAFDTLAIALPHLATAHAYRTFKLMNPALSGLPKYLSPVGGGSTGYNSLQKTVAALHAELRLKATPASLDALPVSESVEDHAPQTPLCIAKLGEQVELYAWMASIEAVVAAQAVEMRESDGGRPQLGAGSALVYDAVRAAVPPLADDRETGLDAEAARDALANPALRQRIEGLRS